MEPALRVTSAVKGKTVLSYFQPLLIIWLNNIHVSLKSVLAVRDFDWSLLEFYSESFRLWCCGAGISEENSVNTSVFTVYILPIFPLQFLLNIYWALFFTEL